MLGGDRNFLLQPGLVLGLFILCASLWSLTIPPFESPDETGHARYVNFLAQKGRLPVAGVDASGEAHQPPLYYLLVTTSMSLLKLPVMPVDPERNPDFRWYGGKGENKYRHTRDELPPLGGRHATLHTLRLVSVIMGAFALYFIHRMALLILPPPAALMATAAAAFLPQFTFVSGSLNNDNLGNLLAAASLCFMASGVHSRERARWGAAGLAAGAGILAKFTCLVLVPCGLLAVYLASRTARDRNQSFPLLRKGMAFLVPALLVSLPLFLRNLFVLGDPLGAAAQVDTLPNLLDRKAIASSYFLTEFPVVLYESFWGRFGWMSFRLPDALYLLLLLPLMTGITGLIMMYRAGRLGRIHLLFLAAAGLQLAQIVIYNLTFTQAQGRFLFPVLGPVVCLLCYGWMGVAERIGLPFPKLRQALLMAGLLAIGNLVVLQYVVAPAYAAL